MVIELTLTLHNLLVSAIVPLHDNSTSAAQNPFLPLFMYLSVGTPPISGWTPILHAPVDRCDLYTLVCSPTRDSLHFIRAQRRLSCYSYIHYCCKMTHFLLLSYGRIYLSHNLDLNLHPLLRMRTPRFYFFPDFKFRGLPLSLPTGSAHLIDFRLGIQTDSTCFGPESSIVHSFVRGLQEVPSPS